MPYISPLKRKKYYDVLGELSRIDITDKGELEYIIFTTMQLYMKTKEKRYTTLHDCTYAAQHCADEFRRRFLDRRENEAILENGDIA